MYTDLKIVLDELSVSKNFLNNKIFIQHGNTTIYEHVISVAEYSLFLVNKYNLKVDKKSLVRGALLHDYFLYDWHIPCKSHRLHGFTHARTSLLNAEKEFDLTEIEKDIIVKHMFPLNLTPPKYLESWIVTYADKVVSSKETVIGLKVKSNNVYSYLANKVIGVIS